jgi:hypothetical protein
MVIEHTEDGGLDPSNELIKGVVIFPETNEELLVIEKILNNKDKFRNILKTFFKK